MSAKSDETVDMLTRNLVHKWGQTKHLGIYKQSSCGRRYSNVVDVGDEICRTLGRAQQLVDEDSTFALCPQCWGQP